MDRGIDYFALFGLPRRYALDETVLNESYRALLARVHPDTVALADAAAKRWAIEETAYVNDAYRILKNPVLRGGYLLECYGAAPLGANEALPAEFLNEQLEAREAADEAWQAGDRDRLESSLISLEAAQREQKAALATLFTGDVPSAAGLAEARRRVLSLQFLSRFAEDLGEKIDA